MMNRSNAVDKQNGDDRERRLMISGVLALDKPHRACAIVERGMPVLSREGQQMGKVAAVSTNDSEAVEAILLSRLPVKMEYRIVPADRVTAVRDHQLILDIAAGEIDGLQKWSTPGTT